MTMTPESPDPSQTVPLDQYLADARAASPDLRPELRARIVAEALVAPSPVRLPVSGGRRLQRWFAGWAMPGLAAGAVAALAGFWIGVSLPMPVVALDLPPWLDAPLSYIDLLALPVSGLDDPLWQEF